jgi:hypothetical protein
MMQIVDSPEQGQKQIRQNIRRTVGMTITQDSPARLTSQTQGNGVYMNIGCENLTSDRRPCFSLPKSGQGG